MKKPLTLQLILQEEHQAHATRKTLYAELKKKLGKPILAYYTSFNHPVMIDDSDAGMIEAVLQRSDTRDGFYLLLSSPGGDGLAAERIINICRSYSGAAGYSVIVPNQAKSAATMISFGANKIIMSPTSELGPVDPQITMPEDNRLKRFSVCNLVESYRELFVEAVKTKGNLEPFIQQLNHYDAREIKEFEDAIQLSVDISVRSLMSGMMKGTSKKDIEKKLAIFLTPKEKKSHGRPIYHEEAQECGLNIQTVDVRSEEWQIITELHLRMDGFVNKHAAKCVETQTESFSAPIPRRHQ